MEIINDELDPAKKEVAKLEDINKCCLLAVLLSIVFRSLKAAPKWPKRAPRGAQESPKTAPRAPKSAPRETILGTLEGRG